MRYRCFFIPEYLIYKFLTKLAVVNWNISNDHKFESFLFSVQFIKRYFLLLCLTLFLCALSKIVRMTKG